jgi:tRNA (guanine-N(7)-)-methyltransferase subunit TRM82
MLQDVSRLQYFSKQADGGWHEDSNMKEALKSFAIQGSTLDVDHGDGAGLASADDKAVRDILYHVENLRKRPGAED